MVPPNQCVHKVIIFEDESVVHSAAFNHDFLLIIPETTSTNYLGSIYDPSEQKSFSLLRAIIELLIISRLVQSK